MSKWRRWLYVKAMLRAINEARRDHFRDVNESKQDGLRVIRRFEKVNKISFDPFNSLHVETVSGWGWNENLLRRLDNE